VRPGNFIFAEFGETGLFIDIIDYRYLYRIYSKKSIFYHHLPSVCPLAVRSKILQLYLLGARKIFLTPKLVEQRFI
jgi:hypothetical protein